MTLDRLVKNKNKIMNYIKQDADISRKLFEAEGNLQAQKQVLKEASTDSFIDGILDSGQYDPWTLEVTDDIINENPQVKEEVMNEKLGISAVKKKAKPKKIKVKKKFVSKTKSGKTYKKSYTKWSKQEETFIKARKTKSTKDISKEFNEFFNTTRTKSSLTTKIYRLRR